MAVMAWWRWRRAMDWVAYQIDEALIRQTIKG